MTDLFDLMSEMFGVNEKELADIFKDGCIKVSHNDKPIIDIDHGVNKLAKEEPKKPVKEKPKEKLREVPKEEPPIPNPRKAIHSPAHLNYGLNRIDSNCYYVAKEIDGATIPSQQVEIQFACRTDDGLGWIPGITDRQLLNILEDRAMTETQKKAIAQVKALF